MNFWEFTKWLFHDRKYAAAKNSPTHNIGSAGSGTVNDEIETSWDEVTERTLALVRDFPIFAGCVNRMEAFITADGILPQVAVMKPDGKVNEKLSREIEEKFMEWAKNPLMCDTAGKLTFMEMQALDDRMQGEFGESIFVDSYVNNQYTISPIEPLNLDDGGFHHYTETPSGNVMWRGIEYKPSNRRVVNYHFRKPVDANNLHYPYDTEVIPAERVKHIFKTQRAGQMRGITPFAPAVLVAYQLRDYMGSELSAQMMSAKWMAWVTAPMSNNWSDNQNRGNIDYNSTYEKYVKTLDNATIEYLKNGEQVTVNTAQRQANSFKNFNEIVIRYVSATTGLPYELLSQDYSGLNYTTLRAVRNDFKQELRPKWMRKILHFCQPVFETWLTNAVLTRQVSIPDYFQNMSHYKRSVKWITPVLEQIDPYKEFMAELLKVRAGAKSMPTVIKEMGGDPDKVHEEIIRWRDRNMEAGLEFPEMTNPSPLISNFGIVEQEEPEQPEPPTKEKEEDA